MGDEGLAVVEGLGSLKGIGRDRARVAVGSWKCYGG